MTVVKELKFSSLNAAMHAAYTTPINAIFKEKLPKWTYIYVSDDNKIVAADVPRDATPSDEKHFVARTY